MGNEIVYYFIGSMGPLFLRKKINFYEPYDFLFVSLAYKVVPESQGRKVFPLRVDPVLKGIKWKR